MVVWDIFGRTRPPAGRHPSASTALLFLAVLAAIGTPARLSAQAVHDVHADQAAALDEHAAGGESGTADEPGPPPATAAVAGGRFRFEPWAGALWDAYRTEGGSGSPAWIGAARFGYELGDGFGPGFRLIAEVARGEASAAGTATVADSLEVEFSSEWWLITGGLEWDAIAGWSGITLEAQGGAAWVTLEVTGGDSIPSGTPGTTARAEAEPYAAARVGISAWRHLTHAMQIRIRLEDVVTDPFDGIEHSPALGVGIRFVFE